MTSKTVYIEPDAVATTCAATTLSRMKDRGLREELARALHPIEAVSFDQCDSVTQAIYRKVADGLLPIIERARAEERERCAKVAEELRHPDYSSETEDWISGTDHAAAAIRGLK